MGRLKKLRIIQWNCRGIINKKGNLERILHNYDIVLLNETWLQNKTNFFLKKFNIIRKDRPNHMGGGLIIAIREDIPFTQTAIYEVPDHLDTLAISIPSDWGELVIVNVYRNPRASRDSINWDTFFDSCSGHFPSIIIGGDFNCHHQSWGCDHSSPCGNKLFDAINDSTLTILNNGSSTRFTRPSEAKSAIDLTIVSSNLTPLSTWRVERDKMGSDHFPISVTFEISCSFFEFFSHKYNLKKVCWSTFHDTLKDEQTDAQSYGVPTPFSALQSYYDLFKLIDDALHKAGPKIGNKPSRDYANSPPWWNEECTKLERLRRAKLGRYRHKCNYENFLDLQKFEATTKRTLKKTKVMGFRSYCEFLSSTTKISNVWTKIRGFRHRLLSPPSPTTSTANTETVTKMKNFIERFHKFSAPPNDLPPIPSLPSSPPPSVDTLTSHHLTAPFRLREMKHALKNSKKNPLLA